jgi:hypothetical protein
MLPFSIIVFYTRHNNSLIRAKIKIGSSNLHGVIYALFHELGFRVGFILFKISIQ